MSGLLSSVASLVGGARQGGSGGNRAGLENMLENMASTLANNPNLRRLTESPAVQQIMSSATDPETGSPNLGRLMSEMAPLVSSFIHQTPPPNAPTAPSALSEADFSALPAERVAVWRRILDEDMRRMEAEQSEERRMLSGAYLAGRVTRATSQSILPREEEDYETSTNDVD